MKTTRVLWSLAIVLAISFHFPLLAQEPACPTPSSTPTPAQRADTRPKSKQKGKRESPEQAKQRAAYVRALVANLGLGEGATIADIGAGNGRDTWVFASVVGPTGKVYAEEIAEDKVKTLRQEAQQRGLTQVQAVLGRDDDPCLPSGAVDMAFMHHVYHHLSKPREMLRGIWRALKPDRYFVVVDQRRGTLQDWVPREERAKKHYWIAETTVVREAREEGFYFVRCAEDVWPGKEQFVLVFQRPKALSLARGDPDPFLPLPLEKTQRLFVLPSGQFLRPVFIALGEARQLIKPLLQESTGDGLDVVLEEWATQKTERPPLPKGVSLPSVLTERGDPHFSPEPSSAVFFLDSYHLLFHHETLLAKIREKLTADGRVYILDRKSPEPLSRRESSHRRKISPDTVIQEMTKAGFQLSAELPAPAPDRFLLVFAKRR